MGEKILVAAAVLVVLYPVAVWLMGFALEQRVDHLAEQGQLMVPQLHLVRKNRQRILTSDEESRYELGTMLKVARHYHRGWYGSIEDAAVEVTAPGATNRPSFACCCTR